MEVLGDFVPARVTIDPDFMRAEPEERGEQIFVRPPEFTDARTNLDTSNQSPWVGLSVMDLAERSAELEESPDAPAATSFPSNGVYIDDVFALSPAAAAGVTAGAFVVTIDGRPVTSSLDYLEKLYEIGVGNTVVLGLQRDGETTQVELAIAIRPDAGRSR